LLFLINVAGDFLLCSSIFADKLPKFVSST